MGVVDPSTLRHPGVLDEHGYRVVASATVQRVEGGWAVTEAFAESAEALTELIAEAVAMAIFAGSVGATRSRADVIAAGGAR